MQYRISYATAFGILGAIIFVIAVFFWVGVFRPSPRQLTETPRAVVTEARGSVTVTRGGVETDVTSGAAVAAGDVLTTGEASAVVITFFDSARAALDANSSVRIDEALIDAAAPHRQNVSLTLVGGRVWSRILKLLDAQSSYGVGYNGVVSGVRGTAFSVTARGATAVIDVFDGTIGVSGKTSGNVPEGFSAAIDTARPPTSVDEVLYPTPDAARNDSWVQEQLDDDAVFSENAIDVRGGLGVEDPVAEYKEVQKDADSGVLRDPGAAHSGYQGLTLLSPSQQYVVSADAPLRLQAFARILGENGEDTRDVTERATWFVSHPERASVESGVVTLVSAAATDVTVTTEVTLLINGKPVDGGADAGDANSAPQNAVPGVSEETVEVVARWHDGTHEHSAAVTVLLAQ